MEETNLNNPERLIKKYYLVDYDNTGYLGLNGIEELDNESVVTIFYSKKAQSIPIQFFQKFLECKANVKFYPIENEDKNIINFQISAYLGYVLGDDKTADCCIVSNDNKLEFLQNFGNTKDKKIKIMSNILGETKADIKLALSEPDEKSESNEKSEFVKAVKHLNLNASYKFALYKIFKEALKQTFAQRLSYALDEIRKNFSQDIQSECYQAIKPLLIK